MNVAFLLGSPDISGGSYVIFQHALAILDAGHTVTVVTWENVVENRLAWFPEARRFMWKKYEDVQNEQYDVVIATWWKTVYEMYRLKSKRYVYFVQSIESRFYSDEEKPLRNLVEATYTLPLYYITEATWIKEYLAEHYDQNAFLVLNGIRKDIYTPDGEAFAKREDGKLRILVEGTVEAVFKNVPRTIELCRQSEADELWLMTPSAIKTYDGVDRLFSKVPVTDTAKVYRSCDVIVKLSYVEGMFGPPLEMFHCGGTSVTYDVTGYDEYIRNNENGIVIKTDNEDEVVAAINRLKRDPKLLKQLKESAIQTANSWPAWDISSGKFLTIVEEISNQAILSNQRQIEILTKFHFESYVIAEKYRLQLLPNAQKHRIGIKQYLKEYHPKLFSFLKKIKKFFQSYR